VWAYLVKEFMLESAPGDHIEMIATHYRTLADLLTQHIIRVLGEEVRTSNL
jgi:hypothetical protein